MLKHDFECTCDGCFKEFELPLLDRENTVENLKSVKIIELAEQEGGLKSYISECLEKHFTNYGKICDCINNENGFLIESYNDNKYRDVCCTCGGIVIEN